MKFEKIILFFSILLLLIIYYFMLPISNYLGLLDNLLELRINFNYKLDKT